MDSHRRRKWNRQPRPLYTYYEPYAWVVIVLALVAGLIRKAVVWVWGN
jgi:hypothetical protein